MHLDMCKRCCRTPVRPCKEQLLTPIYVIVFELGEAKVPRLGVRSNDVEHLTCALHLDCTVAFVA